MTATATPTPTRQQMLVDTLNADPMANLEAAIDLVEGLEGEQPFGFDVLRLTSWVMNFLAGHDDLGAGNYLSLTHDCEIVVEAEAARYLTALQVAYDLYHDGVVQTLRDNVSGCLSSVEQTPSATPTVTESPTATSTMIPTDTPFATATEISPVVPTEITPGAVIGF